MPQEEVTEEVESFICVVMAWIQIVTVSLSYYIGDNLYRELRVHGRYLGCDEHAVLK